MDAPLDASVFSGTGRDMWSGAVVCPASKMRLSTPRARMEICRSGPYRLPALGGAPSGSWFARSGLVTVCPYVPFAPLTSSTSSGGSASCHRRRIPIDFFTAHQRPGDPRRALTFGAQNGAVLVGMTRSPFTLSGNR